MRPASIIRPIVVFILAFLSPGSNLFSQSVINDLKSPNNRFDYVIISPPAYIPAVQPLALRRSVHTGFAVGIAITDSIYSSFGKWTTADTAIKKFITYALATWKAPAPKYFLLAGNVNTVPSHTEQGFTFVGEDSIKVDGWFVEEGADSGLPVRLGAALGRLPAWNLTGLNVMVSKIAAYEDSPEQSWMRRSISVGDSTDAPIFEEIADALQHALSPAWPDTVSVHITPSSSQYLSRVQFRDLWNRGAAIASLIGEANWYKFGRSAYFTTWDVDSLAPGSPLPLCLILAGQRFEKSDTPAIAVSLLQSDSKGAIATVAPSGAVYASSNSAFLQVLGASLAARPAKSIGEAFLTTINSNGLWDQSTRRQTLLGDPALVVRSVVLAGVGPGGSILPGGYVLLQNYPNPFNPTTTIRYGIPRQSAVTLSVFNTLGQQVAILVNETQAAGYHEVKLDGSNLASGMYFYRLTAGNFVATNRLLLLR
jgi:hypothetical protein